MHQKVVTEKWTGLNSTEKREWKDKAKALKKGKKAIDGKEFDTYVPLFAYTFFLNASSCLYRRLLNGLPYLLKHWLDQAQVLLGDQSAFHLLVYTPKGINNDAVFTLVLFSFM